MDRLIPSLEYTDLTYYPLLSAFDIVYETVTHPSTDQSQRCLTLIRREPMLAT